MATLQKVSTCLHFRGNAEEAVGVYTALLPDSRVLSVHRYGEGAPLPAGEPMFLSFELAGTRLHAINGVADWSFTEAMSLMAQCEDQAELDRVWDGLLEGGGETMACGWLKDRFGVCWQVVPRSLETMLDAGDEAANARLMQALWSMVKLDVATLEATHRGAGS